MATAISLANLQAALGEVYDALTSGDYASAHVWLAKAEAQLAGLPLTSVAEGTTAQLRSNLDAVAKALETAEKRSSGARFEKHSRWVP